jgi:hypothetical protein
MRRDGSEVQAHSVISNTNEDALEEDDVEAHGMTMNTHEDELENA